MTVRINIQPTPIRTPVLIKNIPKSVAHDDLKCFLAQYKTDGLVMSKSNQSALVSHHFTPQ